MVELDQDADAVALQTLDHPQLPQRAVAGQRYGRHPTHRVVELAAIARRGERQRAHVGIEVQVRILDPDGMVDPARHLDETLAERREELEPPGDLVPHQLPRDRWRTGDGIEHRQLQGVHVERGGLLVEEAGVEAGETLHGRRSIPPHGSSRSLPGG